MASKKLTFIDEGVIDATPLKTKKPSVSLLRPSTSTSTTADKEDPSDPLPRQYVQFFGVLHGLVDLHAKNPCFKCPYGCLNKDGHNSHNRIKRHFKRQKHGWTDEETSLYSSICLLKGRFLGKKGHHNQYAPYWCRPCNKYVARLRQHYSQAHGMKEEESKDMEKLLIQRIEEAEKLDARTLNEWFPGKFASTSASTESNSDASSEACPGPSHQRPTKAGIRRNDLSVIITKTMRSEREIPEGFEKLFQSVEDLFAGFRHWQRAQGTKAKTIDHAEKVVREIWSCVDDGEIKMDATTNMRLTTMVSELWWNNQITLVMDDLNVKDGDQVGKAPSTVENKVFAWKRFLTFLHTEVVWAGILKPELRSLLKKADYFIKVVKPLKMKQKMRVRHKKGKLILTLGDLRKFTANKKMLSDITQIAKFTPMTLVNALQVRNYLIAMLCTTLGLRTSNLMYVTIGEVDEAKRVRFGYLVQNEEYKTGCKYGTKTLLLPTTIWEVVKLYIENCRDVIADDRKYKTKEGEEKVLSNAYRPLFASKDLNQNVSISLKGTELPSYYLMSSAFTHAITKMFLKTGVITTSRRVTPTLIRTSIVTHYLSMTAVNRSKFARLFMKHALGTSEAYYQVFINKQDETNIAHQVALDMGTTTDTGVMKSFLADYKLGFQLGITPDAPSEEVLRTAVKDATTVPSKKELEDYLTSELAVTDGVDTTVSDEVMAYGLRELISTMTEKKGEEGDEDANGVVEDKGEEDEEGEDVLKIKGKKDADEVVEKAGDVVDEEEKKDANKVVEEANDVVEKKSEENEEGEKVSTDDVLEDEVRNALEEGERDVGKGEDCEIDVDFVRTAQVQASGCGLEMEQEESPALPPAVALNASDEALGCFSARPRSCSSPKRRKLMPTIASAIPTAENPRIVDDFTPTMSGEMAKDELADPNEEELKAKLSTTHSFYRAKSQRQQMLSRIYAAVTKDLLLEFLFDGRTNDIDQFEFEMMKTSSELRSTYLLTSIDWQGDAENARDVLRCFSRKMKSALKKGEVFKMSAMLEDFIKDVY